MRRVLRRKGVRGQERGEGAGIREVLRGRRGRGEGAEAGKGKEVKEEGTTEGRKVPGKN